MMAEALHVYNKRDAKKGFDPYQAGAYLGEHTNHQKHTNTPGGVATFKIGPFLEQSLFFGIGTKLSRKPKKGCRQPVGDIPFVLITKDWLIENVIGSGRPAL